MWKSNKTNGGLRRFRDVTRDVGKRTVPRFRLESHQQLDDVTKLQYFVTSVPKDVSNDEKMERLSELSDVITGVNESDVFVVASWIG